MRKALSAALLALVLVVVSLTIPARAQEVAIRFGVLPVLDTLPLQVAVRDGLFAGQGLKVELIPFASALERDTAMQAGQLDGYFGDLIATYLLINQDVPMYIALTSWRTSPGYPMFGIALSPAARDKGLAELKGASLGLSRSTIMEFLVDKMEQRLGVDAGHFSHMEVKKIPIRLQMLMASQIDAAILPEPLLSLARLKGGGVLATADSLELPLTVLCLHRRYFSDGADVYVRFITAYREAVERLAADPEGYRALMAETCRIPEPLAAEFPVYRYPLPALPADGELDEVQDWMIARGLLREPIPKEMVLSPIIP